MKSFRIGADLVHFLSFFILPYRILKSKTCDGISCKTQELNLIVFCIRYLDLFMYFISLYITFMKLFFILSTVFIIYLIRYKNRTTYDSLSDNFPHFKLLLPGSLVFTAIFNSGWSAWELAWSFSYWLESISFIPQIMIQKKISSVNEYIIYYVVTLTLYRIFYILSWI